MRKSMIFVGMLVIGYANAQTGSEGKVGINTETPSATLNVKSLTGTTSATKNLELQNADGKNLITVLDNGNMGIGEANPTQKLVVRGTSFAQNFITSNEGNEGGHIELHNRHKEGSGISSWVILNMSNNDAFSNKYEPGLHFWRYGANRVNYGSSMVLKDNGELRVGLGDTEINRVKLGVNGQISSASLKASAGTGDRIVYADENGVLKTGANVIESSKIASTNAMECNADNRGKMNFIPSTDNAKSDIFGICMRNKDGNYYWGYMVGGNNPTNGTGAFGSGL